jgi:hypothetical protein
MLANDALAPDAGDAVVSMLAKADKAADEAVHLKVLQTALTLLQSPLRPATDEGIAAVLGVCFRTLALKGRQGPLASTAAATVRQAVAIVFSYVNVDAELERQKRVAEKAAELATVAPGTPGSPGASAADAAEAADPPAAALVAAQRLLEDLIAIATGAQPVWLRTPSLPRTFVLEVLDFALCNCDRVFTALPDFESSLSLRLGHVLQAQLQDHLDAGAAGAPLALSSLPALRALLRCVRTVLLRYHRQLGARCGSLIQAVLRGLGPQFPVFQRVAAAQVVRSLVSDPELVHFLFAAYDMKQQRSLDAVHALVRGATDTIDSSLRAAEGGEVGEASVAEVAALYQAKSQGEKCESCCAVHSFCWFWFYSCRCCCCYCSNAFRLASFVVAAA